jgi:hypothetical protein
LLLLKVAIKFELDSLIYVCLSFLYEKTSTDNLLDILSCLYELINTGSLCFTGLSGQSSETSSTAGSATHLLNQPHSPPPGYSLRPPTPPSSSSSSSLSSSSGNTSGPLAALTASLPLHLQPPPALAAALQQLHEQRLYAQQSPCSSPRQPPQYASCASISSNASTIPLGDAPTIIGPASAAPFASASVNGVRPYNYTESLSIDSNAVAAANLLAPLSPYPERCSPIPGGGRISPYFNGDQSTISQPAAPQQDNITPQQPANSNGHCNRILNRLFFRCFCVLDANAEKILEDPRLALAEHSLLVDVLARDTLRVHHESACFQLLERWCSQQCMRTRRPLLAEHKRALAGRAVYLVRYLAMSADQFIKGPYLSDLLDNDEKDALLAAIHRRERAATASYADQSPPPSPGSREFHHSATIALTEHDHPLPALLQAAGMHRPRRYVKPTCLVAPNRINLNVNNHPLLDELSSVHDHNNNSHGGSSTVGGSRYTNAYGDRCAHIDSPVGSPNGSPLTNSLAKKKASRPKKLLNGIGDFIICFIQLLD